MMLQRYVFKYRRLRFGIDNARANRVFRRAPLHHHFEECGMHEVQVVSMFVVFTMLCAFLSLIYGVG
jgi:phospho-N-acetylmuramoyl-pentapeptide-transferase